MMTHPLTVIPLSTWTTLDQVRSAVISGKLGAISSIASILAAMMAAAVVLKIASDYIEGRGVGIWQLVRPLVLLVFVCQFNTLVLGPLNSMVNVFTRDIASSVNVSTKEYVTQWGQNMAYLESYNMAENEDTMEKALEEISESGKGAIGKFFAKLWEGIKKFFRNFFSITSLTTGALIGGLLFLIVKVLLFVQQVLCSLYLTVAGLIGPVVFALAIVSGYSGGIKSWIARYIQIAMWIPIGYMVMYINLQVGNVFMHNAAGGSSVDLSTEWFMIALQVVALVSVAAVPKIAGWVIESTGANDAHASVSQPARQVARKIIKF